MADSNERILTFPRRILDEISKVVIGKEETKEALLIALIAGGHVLIEGHPGTAKTTLAQAFARAIGGKFKRVQLTPDMMPADITGFYLYSAQGSQRFVEGPLFSNLVLADELNRTTPRTQSALLEAMAEGQVSIEGETRLLPRPFMLVATQVEAGGEGTYPLTDVQLDRFLLRTTSRMPTREEERTMITAIDKIDGAVLSRVVDLAEVEQVILAARKIHVAGPVTDYILDLIGRLRQDPDIAQVPGPRGTIALHKCARARALLEGRDFVIPDDVKRLASPVLGHRLRVKSEAEMEGVTPEMVVTRVLEQVAVPKVNA